MGPKDCFTAINSQINYFVRFLTRNLFLGDRKEVELISSTTLRLKVNETPCKRLDEEKRKYEITMPNMFRC